MALRQKNVVNQFPAIDVAVVEDEGEEQLSNKEAWYKKKSSKVILLIILLVIIVAGACTWVWIKVSRNRRFNRKHCSLGKAPFIMPMDECSKTYFRRSPTSSHDTLPSGRYDFDDVETIGLDLTKLKTGDLILSRFIRGKDKTQEFETLCRHFPANPPIKTWVDAGWVRRAKHWTDKEAMHQYYTGKRAPTHVCMVGRVTKPANGKKLALADIQIWNIAWEGRETLTLKEYLNRYPCTMAFYWVAHLNLCPPDAIVDLVEDYVEHVSQPQYWYRSLGMSYLQRSRGLSLASRSTFYDCLYKSSGSTSQSSMSEGMLNLDACKKVFAHVRPDDDNRMVPKILSNADGYIDSTDNVLVEVDMSDSNPTQGWRDWRGLDHVHYSCSGLIYAYLEAFGLCLPMSDALSLKRIKNNGDMIVAGQIETIELQDVLDLAVDGNDEQAQDELKRQWNAKIHFDPTSRIRIMAPQTIAPCDFLRCDFQWAPGICIKFLSRFYCVNKA